MSAPDSSMTIRSAQGAYIVEQYRDLAVLFAELTAIENAMLIADERVADLYASDFARLGSLPLYRMAAAESEKTLAGVERALLALQASGASKKTTVIAIGGGIIQDVATLVAHLWYRGVDFVYVPTTLLSMADSCIGAKSAVNLGSFKNQIGTFQSPKRVLTSPRFIETLSDEAVASGYGEIVKLAIVESPAAFERVRDDVAADGMRGPALMRHIEMSLETKRKIIEADEYELNLRKTLNFGHTFGHALESVVDNEIPHGIAVAWGVDVASYVAVQTGLAEPAFFDSVHRSLARTFHFTMHRPYSAPALIAAMKRDKKAASGNVSLILPRTFGALEIVPTAIDSDLERIVADYLRQSDLFATR